MVIKGPQTVEKIRKALELIRNQHFEVPYIAKNLKEYFLPEFSANNLRTVSKFDEEWTQLESLKKIMMFLCDEIPNYQSEKKDELKRIESYEQLSDFYYEFILHYGNEAPSIQKKRQREREEAQEWRSSAARPRFNEDGEPMDGDESSEDLRDPDDVNVDLYCLCARAGLDGLVKEYGLTLKQPAENTHDNNQRHKFNQPPTEPSIVALEYVSPEFPTAAKVLQAANYMLAVQIAREPMVRQLVRESLFERARIDVIPTKKGFMEIDENHPLYSLKFLKDKPLRDLVEDQFIQLVVAERSGLLTIVYQTEIEGATTTSYVDEIKALFTRDGPSKLEQKWDDLRKEIIDLALSKFLFPLLKKKLKEKLLNEAKEFVFRACCQQLYNGLKVCFILIQIFFLFH
jgi:transcription elongation factor SPT6